MIRLNCPDFGLRDPRRLGQRYVMALGLVLATVLVGHTMYGNALRDLNPLLASVSDVNQQQILGNKILLVLRNEERQPDAEVLNNLRDSVDRFEAAHNRAVAVARRVPSVSAHSTSLVRSPSRLLRATPSTFLDMASKGCQSGRKRAPRIARRWRSIGHPVGTLRPAIRRRVSPVSRSRVAT